jgi:hydrogenase-4 membrane subunit HyfE
VTFTIFAATLIAFIIFTLFRFDFLGSFYYYLSGVSVIFTFFFVSLVMVFLIPPFAQQAEKLFSRHLILPAVFALILTFVELFISYKLHQLMVRLAT